MGLIQKEIEELRDLLKLLKQGKITPELLHSQVEIYNQVVKRERLLIHALTLATTSKLSIKELIKANLIGEMVAVDIGETPALEKLKCELEGQNIITREQCLELSGEVTNYEICIKCPIFSITRRSLLGENA